MELEVTGVSSASRRINRLARLVFAFDHRSSVTADQLACWLNVSTRTIYRDLEVLAEAGLPVEYDSALRRYSVGSGFSIIHSSLTRDERHVLATMIDEMLARPGAFGDPAATRSCANKLLNLVSGRRIFRTEAGST